MLHFPYQGLSNLLKSSNQVTSKTRSCWVIKINLNKFNLKVGQQQLLMFRNRLYNKHHQVSNNHNNKILFKIKTNSKALNQFKALIFNHLNNNNNRFNNSRKFHNSNKNLLNNNPPSRHSKINKARNNNSKYKCRFNRIYSKYKKRKLK